MHDVRLANSTTKEDKLVNRSDLFWLHWLGSILLLYVYAVVLSKPPKPMCWYVQCALNDPRCWIPMSTDPSTNLSSTRKNVCSRALAVGGPNHRDHVFSNPQSARDLRHRVGHQLQEKRQLFSQFLRSFLDQICSTTFLGKPLLSWYIVLALVFVVGRPTTVLALVCLGTPPLAILIVAVTYFYNKTKDLALRRRLANQQQAQQQSAATTAHLLLLEDRHSESVTNSQLRQRHAGAASSAFVDELADDTRSQNGSQQPTEPLHWQDSSVRDEELHERLQRRIWYENNLDKRQVKVRRSFFFFTAA